MKVIHMNMTKAAGQVLNHSTCKAKGGKKEIILKNGSILLKDLIASCDGKSHPIRCYSAAEIIRATNNFDRSCIIDGVYSGMFRGILDDRTVIIKQHYNVDGAIRDIIISMQMSTIRIP
ncbi:Protein kinase superfamily protein [Prunus dulcis]|uniref:Protein kinase superfamily protein n=1 Tax=Prunus dulcis TaxID=3755 RepID=A0A5H2XMI2_PRUDU|nr:Protein kinase superfamily protein [Prunus dulcis]